MQPLTLTVSTQEPSINVAGLKITTALYVEPFYEVLGQPSRVSSGPIPAPAGHRNGQRHIYDSLGITFLEHHFNYQATCVDCWFNTSDPQFEFTPQQDFTGNLIIDGTTMPLGGDVREFLASAPVKFDGGFGGGWHYHFGDFCVFVSSRGRMLRSGRRSKVRHVTSVSLSWPHDPWQKPDEFHATGNLG